MGFRQGFIPLGGQEAPSLLDTVAKYRGLEDMARQRQEDQRMRELATSAIDPATGQVDEDAFMTAITAEFPLKAREMQQGQLMSASKAMQANANLGKTLAETRYKQEQSLTAQDKRKWEKENKLLELKARDFIRKDPALQDLMGTAHKDIESYNKFSTYLMQSPFGQTKSADNLLKRVKTKGTDLITALMAQQNAALDKYERQEEIKREQVQKARGSAIPGYEPIPGIEVTAANTKEASQALTRTSVINDLLGGLINKYEQEGVTVIPGETQAEMESTVTDIQMELKELNNLGVLAGPDMGLLLAQLPDPTSIEALAKQSAGKMLGKGDPIMSKFKTFKKNLDRKLKSKMGSYGFRKKPKAAASGWSEDDEAELQRLRAKYPNVGQ